MQGSNVTVLSHAILFLTLLFLTFLGALIMDDMACIY